MQTTLLLFLGVGGGILSADHNQNWKRSILWTRICHQGNVFKHPGVVTGKCRYDIAFCTSAL